MPTFEYIAKDPTGREVRGSIQADTEAGVVRTLDQRHLYAVRIGTQAASAAVRRRGGRIRIRHLSATYGQLSDLLSAGVPMLRALEILSRTTVSAALGEVITAVREEVAAGETLADAMAKYPQAFTELHVAMVKAGETAGFLEDVLSNLASFLERQDDLRAKVRGAMIYPSVLITVGVMVISVLLIFFVPNFKDYLADVPLPLPSKIVFAASDVLRSHAPLLLGGLFLVAMLARAFVRSETGRALWAGWKLRLPVAGGAIRMVAITRFCRVLGTMLTNGVPILQALTISKGATGNRLMSDAIGEATENVRAGEPLAEPLRRSGFFPPEIVEMIAIAEESNQLEKVLVHVADTVERRTNRQVDAAVRLIEPLLLVVIAAMVAFIALGLYYPLFTMARTLM